jgi:PIN domain nuclease of toxin-antitoxin system
MIKEITPAIAALAMHFRGNFPGNPADRLIAATARAEGIPLVTRDTRMRASPLADTIW